MSSKRKARAKPKPLKITCTSSDCDSGLHCFRKSRDMAKEDQGKCRSCGANLIKWKRVHQRSLDDVKFTFESLKNELIRHHFWHKPVDLKAQNHVRRKGRNGIKEAARKRIKKSVGPAELPYDGRQTPLKGNIIFYAQHALACCCRTCMEYWHDVPKGVELSNEQIDYFVELVMLYIDERMPSLTESGEYVPPIRNKKQAQIAEH